MLNENDFLYRILQELDVNEGSIETENDQWKVLQTVKLLQRVRLAMLSSNPEKSGSLFICGFGGNKDEMGLPEYISICPNYGLAGTATYKKITNYSEPGW